MKPAPKDISFHYTNEQMVLVNIIKIKEIWKTKIIKKKVNLN